jgi:2-polyprenyl-3-methyl-5-hydroxy-6-metoxy-1,4-benzoquinol methylase
MKNVDEKNIVIDKEWFRKWFDSPFYQKLYINRNEKEAALFINELIDELHPLDNSRMLDLGCGYGRHSKCLARKGFDVTGIDLAASSIREAKKMENSLLRFYQQDMRTPFGKNLFDYVFNFFTSFGYFDDPSDDHKVIANIAAALKPGGILVMDYINAALAEKKLIATEEKDVDGIIYHITRWTNEEYIFKKIVIDEKLFGQPIEYIERVRKFSVADFEKLFSSHYLQVTNVYGDYRLNKYEKDSSSRIILIAKKNQL